MLTSTTTFPTSWSATPSRAQCLPDKGRFPTSSQGPLSNARAYLARGSPKKPRKSRLRRELLESTRFLLILKDQTQIKHPLRNLASLKTTKCLTTITIPKTTLTMRVRPTAMAVATSSLNHHKASTCNITTHKAIHTASSTSTAHIIINSTFKTSITSITMFNRMSFQQTKLTRRLFPRPTAWTKLSSLTRYNRTNNITPIILSNHPTTWWRPQEKDHSRLAWTKWANSMPITLPELTPTSHPSQDTTLSTQTRSQAQLPWEARTDRQ